MIKLAIGISVVMHPLLMTTYLFALLFFYAPLITRPLSAEAASYILLALFITTFILPVLSITALRFSSFGTIISGTANKFTTLSLPLRRDRVLPLFFTSLFYIITTYMFAIKLRVNLVLVVILAAISAIILLLSATTLFTKLSTHATGSGAMVGFLVGLSIRYPQSFLLIPTLVAVVLMGGVMSAQLYLGLHSAEGVWLGAGFGLVVSLGAILLFVG